MDAAKLTALVQNVQGSDGGVDWDAVGAPAAAVYQSHSGSIVTLEDVNAAHGELAASQAAMTKLSVEEKDASEGKEAAKSKDARLTFLYRARLG